MIIGESNCDQDLAVNVCKGKNSPIFVLLPKTIPIQLKGAKDMSLEQCLSFLNDDEYLEVTPKALRLRKRFFNAQERNKYNKQRTYE